MNDTLVSHYYIFLNPFTAYGTYLQHLIKYFVINNFMICIIGLCDCLSNVKNIFQNILCITVEVNFALRRLKRSLYL